MFLKNLFFGKKRGSIFKERNLRPLTNAVVFFKIFFLHNFKFIKNINEKLKRKKISKKIHNTEYNLLIDGYPRSGNTYVSNLLKSLIKEEIKIFSHFHSSKTLGLFLNKHNCLIIILYRKPEKAITSYYSYLEGIIRVKKLLKMYCEFYEKVLKLDAKNIIITEPEKVDKIIPHLTTIFPSIKNLNLNLIYQDTWNKRKYSEEIFEKKLVNFNTIVNRELKKKGDIKLSENDKLLNKANKIYSDLENLNKKILDKINS